MIDTIYSKFIEIIGSYSPIMVKVSETSEGVDIMQPCIDWSYIAAAGLFIVCVWGFLRIVGNFVNKGVSV